MSLPLPYPSYFLDPVRLHRWEDGLYYLPAVLPGYAQLHPETVVKYAFPDGPAWGEDEQARLADILLRMSWHPPESASTGYVDETGSFLL